MNYCKHLVRIIPGIFLPMGICHAQQVGAKDSTFPYDIPVAIGINQIADNIVNDSVVSVLDGVQLTKDRRIGGKIKTIRKLNDPGKLQEMGIKHSGGSYIFY